jgi:hypothetical protein
MNRAIRATGVCLLVLAAGVGAFAQEERTIEERLVVFSEQLRLGLTLATVAAYSPTLGDLRLHAQQLVNLLEGPQGKHFVRPVPAVQETPGLLVEATALVVRFEAPSVDPEVRGPIGDAAKNVRTYLAFALETALSALDERRIDRASTDMLRTYAFLFAAYEKPCDVTYVPALATILRAFELVKRAAGGNDPP